MPRYSVSSPRACRVDHWRSAYTPSPPGGEQQRRFCHARRPGRRIAETGEAPFEVAVAGEAIVEFEAEPRGGGPRLLKALGMLELREIDQALVVAEIDRLQLGMTVDAEPLDDEPLEMADEEVGEKEAARLLFGELGEEAAAGEELVAMRAGDALRPLLFQHRIERA